MLSNIVSVQNRLLSIAQVVVEILNKYNIPYVLMCGTLLGAIRHGGFIPWDDDFDICLFDNSYEQALCVLRKELPDNLFVEDSLSEPKYFHAWAHVKDLNSSAYCEEFPQDNVYSHKGVYIDLYKFVRIPLCKVTKYQNNENKSYIMRRANLGLISDDEYVARIEALKCAEKKEKVSDDFRNVFTWISIYKCKYLEIDDIIPIKNGMFENMCFSIPNNPENVLQAIYGNYNILPPTEKRRTHYSKVDLF